jgi:hypothetical protein
MDNGQSVTRIRNSETRILRVLDLDFLARLIACAIQRIVANNVRNAPLEHCRHCAIHARNAEKIGAEFHPLGRDNVFRHLDRNPTDSAILQKADTANGKVIVQNVGNGT